MPARSSSEFLFDALESEPFESNNEHSITTGVETDFGQVRCFHKPESGEIGLIIPCSQAQYEAFKPDKRTQAIHLTRLLIGRDPQVRLSLKEPRQSRVFYLFVDDLLSKLDERPKNGPHTASLSLDNWRRFFKTSIGSGLTVEEEIGLLCELEVLDALIRSGETEAVDRWVGPLLRHHDFEFSDFSIECKATRSSTSLAIAIHGAEQLTPTGNKRLTLVVRKYQSDPDGFLSVPSMCEQIVSRADVPVAAFMEKVRLLGIDPWNPLQLDQFSRFNPLEAIEFDIVEKFPRVRLEDNDHRITNVQYSIDLAGAPSIPGFKAVPSYLN